MGHCTPSVPRPHGFLQVRSWRWCHPFCPPGSWDRWVWWTLPVAWWCVNRSKHRTVKRPAPQNWVWKSFKQPNSGEKKKKKCYQEVLTQGFVTRIAYIPISLSSEYQRSFFSKRSMPFFLQLQEHSSHQAQPSSFLSPWSQQLEPHKNTSFCFSREVYLLLSQQRKDIPAWEEQTFFCIKCHLWNQK